MSICDTFKSLALKTWEDIRRSRSVNFQLKEETFTDNNTLELKLRHSGQVMTKVFTKRQEGINGADWEWWFKGHSNTWIGFRVQAKILNIQTNEFEHLHYKSLATGVYQSDKLIRNALSGSIPRIPIYCLFLQTNEENVLNKWNCGTFNQLKKLYGCSLISAFTVKQLRVNKEKHLIDIESYLKPWHCLVCCRGYGKSDFISNIEAYALNSFSLRDDNINSSDFDIPEKFITDKPPNYVLELLENRKDGDVKLPDNELYGVTLIVE